MYDAAVTMLFSGPEVTSPIFAIIAEGVRGGLMRRRDSVVVCDLRSLVEALITSRGSAISVSDVGAASLVGAREDW